VQSATAANAVIGPLAVQEERLQQARGLFSQQTALHRVAMVQTRQTRHIAHRAQCAALGITGSEHNALNPRVDQCASTHGTWLKCYIKSRV
jgi:hypothetical protein